MLNKLFSRIGKSIAPSGGGVVSAVSVKKEGNLPYGTFISEETMIAYGDVGGVSAGIGTFYRQVYADGSGGTYTSDTIVTYYPSGTELRQESGSTDIYLCSGYYSVGGYTNRWFADGSGGFYTGSTGGYSSYGTYLTNCDGYNHYSDGNGGYYSESDGSGGSGTSYPSYGEYSYTSGDYIYYHDGNGGTYSVYSPPSYPSSGTPTGNSGSGTNYIEINGSSYDNGFYSYTEYHNGSGGYYNSYSYEYKSYGHNFTSYSYYDEGMMSTVYVNYNSDGSGGYYTSY